MPFFEGANDVNGSGEIQVFLDQSDLQVTTLIRKKLYETYSKFSEHLMTDCGKAKEAANTGITFEAAFGQLDFDFKSTIIPGFLLGYQELIRSLIRKVLKLILFSVHTFQFRLISRQQVLSPLEAMVLGIEQL